LTLILYWQTSALFFRTYYYVLSDMPDADWCWLTLPDFNSIGHSALRTMWLSAPVLVYVPVDVSHWLYAPPQPLNARVGVWCCSGWLICGKCRTCSLGAGTVALKQLRQPEVWGKRSYKCAWLVKPRRNLIKNIPYTHTHLLVHPTYVHSRTR
jgi:hypothetical protein